MILRPALLKGLSDAHWAAVAVAPQWARTFHVPNTSGAFIRFKDSSIETFTKHT
jgi:hypothetical protein